MYALMSLYGLLLAPACVVTLLQKRITTLNKGAILCATVSFGLWPDQVLIGLDRLLHVQGFGYMFTRIVVNMAVLLHLVDACRGMNLWDRRRMLMLAPALVSTIGFFAAWLMTQRVHAANPEHFYYYGYRGHPDAVFATSIMVGVMSACYALFGLYVYARATLIERKAERTTFFVIGSVVTIGWVGDVVMSLLASAEGLVEHSGPPSDALLWSIRSTMVTVCGAFTAIYVCYTVVRPLWLLKKEIDALPAARAELEQLRDDITEANLMFSDQLVLVRLYADPAIVGGVAARCRADSDLGVYERTVAWEAANVITLNPAHIHRMYRVGEKQPDPGAMVRDAMEFAALAEREMYVYADVYYVVALVFGAEQLGVRLKRVEDWHRKVADLILAVMAAYEQPLERLDAYRRYKEHQELLRQDVLRDVLAGMAG